MRIGSAGLRGEGGCVASFFWVDVSGNGRIHLFLGSHGYGGRAVGALLDQEVSTEVLPVRPTQSAGERSPGKRRGSAHDGGLLAYVSKTVRTVTD